MHSWDTEKLNRCAPFAAYDNFVAQRESVLRTFVLNNKLNKNLRVASSHPLGAMTAEEAFLLEKLDLTRLPRHVAVIMDGNGRWAQKRHLPRIAGHRSGTQSARTTIETCARLQIDALTSYAFSVENRSRAKDASVFSMPPLP